MPVYSWRNMPADRPGVDFVWRAGGGRQSALNRHALSAVFNNRRKRRPWRAIRTPGVNQGMGSQMFGPFEKSDGLVVEGLGARYLVEQAVDEVSKEAGEISEAERRIALATNAAGVAAAPGLIWMAARSARNNEGSWPRAVGRAAEKKILRQRAKAAEGRPPKKVRGRLVDNPVTRAAGRTAAQLDRPTTRAARAGSLAAAGGLLGLQVGNVVGDAIAARAMAGAKPAKED